MKGISTFMAEMVEAACILNTATQRTMVIVDELGRGTSTGDGLGLAWAIAKHLVDEIKCFTLFATHFHELADLAGQVKGVENHFADAIVDEETGNLTFLYKIKPGFTDQSYGLHVAKLAKFPAEVLEKAKKNTILFAERS